MRRKEKSVQGPEPLDKSFKALHIKNNLKQTEAQFQKAVIQLAKVCGWKVYHTRFSFGSNKGFPDLILVKKDRSIVFAELKADGKVPTPEQREWLLALSEAKWAPVYLWCPSDFPLIEKILMAGMK